ncbi:hypothetical protein BCR34DRAFT_54328 [Clohesyomyces aquaticus]|uniref:Uncharacterized protein n=1 Tax=Clohesyomyces aquaticus TaxID=1231657 RepID=A0A1Y1Z3A5_9PLEO|nr:hypothetical protein BCR34DRAFT_54328 [Clohesyomyces aquaticus]
MSTTGVPGRRWLRPDQGCGARLFASECDEWVYQRGDARKRWAWCGKTTLPTTTTLDFLPTFHLQTKLLLRKLLLRPSTQIPPGLRPTTATTSPAPDYSPPRRLPASLPTPATADRISPLPASATAEYCGWESSDYGSVPDSETPLSVARAGGTEPAD